MYLTLEVGLKACLALQAAGYAKQSRIRALGAFIARRQAGDGSKRPRCTIRALAAPSGKRERAKPTGIARRLAGRILE
jgi:hypothetical protein